MKSLIFVFVPLFVLGCKNSSSSNDMGAPDMAMATLGAAPQLAIACSDKVSDVYTLPTGLPAMDDSHRGDVFHCAVSESLTKDKVNAQINAYNMSPPVTGIAAANTEAGNAVSGFWTYRVAYRSERNTLNGTRAEGDMAAVLVIPEKPLAGAPLVVWSHGSVGVASKCAPSLVDLTSAPSDLDFPINLYKLAGYGYTVIAPDYAGFSFNQAPVGYFNAEDEAHAILDATRAAANLLPSPPSKVVLVGHSQGGHAVIAAQTYASAYGMKGTLVGVAAFAPLWVSMSIWAAATSDLGQLSTASDVSSILYSMEYNYSAGELRNPGHGKDVFQAAKQQAAVDAMYGGECYDSAKVQALGAKPSDFYDPTFVMNDGNCAISLESCTPAAPWPTYWMQDRPAIDPQGAPLLLFFGGMDMTVKPAWAACARDSFNTQQMATGATVKVTMCIDNNAQHRDIIRGTSADYVNQWIAAQAGAGTAPMPCTPFPSQADLACGTPFKDL